MELAQAWRIIPEKKSSPRQQNGILASVQSYSVYVHFPFCQHRCAYCDFNTYAGLSDLIPQYTNALCKEISYLAQISNRFLPVHTVFFGGGTPSLMPANLLEMTLSTLKANFEIAADAEVTLEANPGTLTLDYLKRLKSAGVNRISLGMQSALVEELRFLEREHDFLAVIQSVSWARKAGFDNISLDLIFGLPEQPLESWQRSLQMAVNLNPDHLSIYSLTLEHGTPLYHWAERGLVSPPDGDMAADMYEWTSEFLESTGYLQYEISNWAKLDGQHTPLLCRHNLQYWRLDPYLGFGAGAHGFVAGFHTANVLSPGQYIQRLIGHENAQGRRNFPKTPATASIDPVDIKQEMGETMIMGLRLTIEGVSNERFHQRFGILIQHAYKDQVEALVNSGLLEWAGDHQENLRLTQRGRLLGNRVFMQFA